MNAEQAEFVERTACISCGSERLDAVAGGGFDDEPLRGFIQADPWGVSPLPFVAGKGWTLVRCADCAQMFHRSVLSERWNERRFSEWMTESAMRQFTAPADTPEAVFERGRNHVEHILRIERLTRSLRSGHAVSLLDFGCGWGEFLNACRGFGFSCCGVDRSAARRQAGHFPIFSRLEELAELPAATAGFHAVTLFEVLEHLDDPLSLLRALSGLMVDRGVLVLETPDCTGVSGIRVLEEYRKVHPLDHINAFTPATLRGIAARAGFAPVHARAVHVTGEPVRLLKKEVKNLLHPLLRPTTRQYFRKVR